jgi:PAS domain S-box-containing protein
VSNDDVDDPTTQELGELRERIAYLQQALSAISNGGVDAVVFGEGDQERVYTLTSADRPYRVIVESMGEGAVTLSESGVILYVNLQVADFLAVDPASMIGRDLADYIGDEQRETLASLLEASGGDTRRAELTIARPDGTEVPFLVSATDLDIEGVLVRCLVLTDLTMHKLVEAQATAQAAQAQRRRVAREANDSIVQGLVAAEMALDLGQVDYARQVIGRTSSKARSWIGELTDEELTPGMAVRSTPAEHSREE